MCKQAALVPVIFEPPCRKKFLHLVRCLYRNMYDVFPSLWIVDNVQFEHVTTALIKTASSVTLASRRVIRYLPVDTVLVSQKTRNFAGS